MRNKSLMGITIALILAVMAGTSLGDTLNMPGGSSSVTGTSATATGNTVLAFDYDANNIQADILAVASATGEGSVTTNAHGVVSSTATGSRATLGLPAPLGLTVTAKGTVDVNVKGTNDYAVVTSVAQIHSKASLDGGLNGEAWIYSGIGNEWVPGAGGSIQKGNLVGNPEGTFEADSMADGVATYSGIVATTDAEEYAAPEVPTTQTLSVSGSAGGKTTLAAEVNYANGVIGGRIDGLGTADPAEAKISSSSSVVSTIENYVLTEGTITAANNNYIKIAASNDRNFCEENPEGALTWVSGTATGTAGNNKAEGKSYHYTCDPISGLCDKETFAANTEKADSMTADVRTFAAGDQASASAVLNPTAEITGATDAWISTAENNVYNSAFALRVTSGDQAKQDAGSEERVYGKAYFGGSSWNADAYHTLYHRTAFNPANGEGLVETTKNSKASVSGNLAQVTKNGGEQPTGMNAAAYLLFKKTDGAGAFIQNEQVAQADEFADTLTSRVNSYGKLTGPRAKSLGGVSSWDGVGFYASFKNLNVNAANDFTADRRRFPPPFQTHSLTCGLTAPTTSCTMGLDS